MRFTGQLLLPGESGPGLKVNLDVAEHHLAVESNGGGLGAWPLEVVEVERLHGEVFGLNVAGEALRFVADDTIAFAYSAVPAIEQVSARSRARSGVRSMFGRLWNAPDTRAQPAGVETLPIDPDPVDVPPQAEAILDLEEVESWSREQDHDEVTVDEAVTTEPPAPSRPTEPPAASGAGSTADAASAIAHCPAVRSDGRRCESQILTESGFCYPHDPSRTIETGYQAAQEARAQLKKDATGRLNRIYGRLDKAMRQVERGELDPETAMAMAQLAKTMCAILQIDESTPDEG